MFSEGLKDESKKQETGFGTSVDQFAFSSLKHETVQRPLYQAVGHLEAVIRVGQVIIALRGRTSSPGEVAEGTKLAEAWKPGTEKEGKPDKTP